VGQAQTLAGQALLRAELAVCASPVLFGAAMRWTRAMLEAGVAVILDRVQQQYLAVPD
jgi:hypothetical protein